MTSDTSSDLRGAGGVQALETGLSVLDAFAGFVRPAMLKDIAHAAAMHPAKAHRYLVSFIKFGYVEQDAHGRYSLGRNALRMGLAGLAQVDAIRLVTPLLDELSVTVGETVLAAVWGNRGPTVVQWRDSPHPVTVNVRPGSVMPLLASATGRVFTAFLDPALTASLIADELKERKAARVKRFPETAKDVKELARTVRDNYVGVVVGDLVPGINSVSAPVFDHDGRLVLAITALGNDAVFNADPAGPIADAVRQAARTLSDRLGHGVLPGA
ncbi:IclR family transcriptional regulator [Pigmentiphaga litoralis]|jgi:DNA-binding IclR family transcriptional regulator|uniref:IclR family transcriptional regulator n=1 Tax=Pigmentiphaga litoralis TaxID=516702 RepID=UPI00167826EC|nr:IclR family transcriptional regulator [Pigmentiphaga litoralis]GGX21203.1 IclR family transcriptional regulator [Pigmentiphaga litoralis]